VVLFQCYHFWGGGSKMKYVKSTYTPSVSDMHLKVNINDSNTKLDKILLGKNQYHRCHYDSYVDLTVQKFTNTEIIHKCFLK
jgi:hypothetical protein